MNSEHFPSFAAAKMRYGSATQAMIDAGKVTIGLPKPKSRDDSDLHEHQMEASKEIPEGQTLLEARKAKTFPLLGVQAAINRAAGSDFDLDTVP